MEETVDITAGLTIPRHLQEPTGGARCTLAGHGVVCRPRPYACGVVRTAFQPSLHPPNPGSLCRVELGCRGAGCPWSRLDHRSLCHQDRHDGSGKAKWPTPLFPLFRLHPLAGMVRGIRRRDRLPSCSFQPWFSLRPRTTRWRSTCHAIALSPDRVVRVPRVRVERRSPSQCSCHRCDRQNCDVDGVDAHRWHRHRDEHFVAPLPCAREHLSWTQRRRGQVFGCAGTSAGRRQSHSPSGGGLRRTRGRGRPG